MRSFVPPGLLSGNQGDAHSSRVGDVETRLYQLKHRSNTNAKSLHRRAFPNVFNRRSCRTVRRDMGSRQPLYIFDRPTFDGPYPSPIQTEAEEMKKLLATTQNEKDKKANLISDWRQSVRFERDRRTLRVNRSGGLPGIGGDGAGVLGVARRSLDGRVGTTTTTTLTQTWSAHIFQATSRETSAQTHIDRS